MRIHLELARHVEHLAAVGAGIGLDEPQRVLVTGQPGLERLQFLVHALPGDDERAQRRGSLLGPLADVAPALAQRRQLVLHLGTIYANRSPTAPS